MTVEPPSRAGLGRRCLSLVYEGLMVLAVAIVAGLIYQALFGPIHDSWGQTAFQFAAVGAYFVPQWVRGGQTLPMKTWRMRIEAEKGQRLDWRRALLRYVLASLSLLTVGLGFLWALFDRDRQFFHDRVAGTRIVDLREAAIPYAPGAT